MKRNLNSSLVFLFLIIMVAFIIRATCNRLDYMSEGAPDQYGYEASQIAGSVAAGHGFGNPYPLVPTGPTALMPPAYIYLLAAIYKELGVQTDASYIAATTLSGLFSALACIPIFWLGRRVANDAVGLCGAAFWAVFPSAVILTTGPFAGVWDTALSMLLAASVLAAVVQIRDTDRTRAWIGLGLLCALALEVNPAIFSVLPFLFAWLVWQLYQRRSKWLRLPAAAVLMIVLGCAPWALRNWVTFHHFIPFRSNFGLELWLGNNQFEDHDLFPDWRSPYNSWPEQARLTQIGETAFMQQKKAAAIKYIEAHPRQTVRSIYTRFAVIWTGLDVRVSAVWGGMSAATRTFYVINLLLVICGWSGMWVMFRHGSPLAWPFLIYLVFYPAVYYITHAQLRYRHPIDPALTVLSTFAVFCAARAVSRRFLGVSPPSSSAAEALPSPAAD